MSEQLAAPGGQPTEKGETEYVVLRMAADSSGWTIERKVNARSADSAIRSFVNGYGQTTEATLVAVPARSWKPVRVKPKTVTTLVIEEA